MKTIVRYLLILTYLTTLFAEETIAQNSSEKPTYVIVHGAYGGSWAFKEVDELLTADGNKVYRPCLTGHGERSHLASPDIDLDTHIQDVVNVILFEELHDIILVGHSYGGMVISGVMDRVPDRIKKVIYLDAFVPNDGESVVSITGRGTGNSDKDVKDGFMIPPWLDLNKKPPMDVPQSYKTFTQPVALKNAALTAKIPTTYVLFVAKNTKPENASFAWAAERAKARGWTFYEMTSDHNAQWSVPKTLVEMLERD